MNDKCTDFSNAPRIPVTVAKFQIVLMLYQSQGALCSLCLDNSAITAGSPVPNMPDDRTSLS